MNLNTVKDFRHAVYGCFQRAGDALFNSVDALLSEDRAHSFPELSLSPYFERRWPSLYEAFEDGRINEQRLKQVLVDFLPATDAGALLWIGIDTSGIARPGSFTSADRSAQHVHNLPECDKPVTYGWQFSTILALPQTPSSWTYILDQQRVSTETTAAQVALAQLSHLDLPRPEQAIAVLDRGYDSTWLWCQRSTLPLKGTLVRLKGNRCFYRMAPARTGKRGAPRKDGDKLQPDDPSTHDTPSGHSLCLDAKGREIEISWWSHMHMKGARWLEMTVIRVVRPHATNKDRDPRISWFVWIGDQQTDIVNVALGYVLRFSQEHSYRFDKQSLLWEEPRLRTPEQFERWSHIVVIAHNHLVLARELVAAELRPWETKQREPTPQQVRHGMSKLLPLLGTPTRPPPFARKIAGSGKRGQN